MKKIDWIYQDRENNFSLMSHSYDTLFEFAKLAEDLGLKVISEPADDETSDEFCREESYPGAVTDGLVS